MPVDDFFTYCDKLADHSIAIRDDLQPVLDKLEIPPRDGRELLEQISYLREQHEQEELIEMFLRLVEIASVLDPKTPSYDVIADEIEVLWYAVTPGRRPRFLSPT